ncbi:hypothetical protein WH47_00680 [Habropoda laboriosa]|uniref:Uncharacterized protein n=1 Tax=Habropoda laboriosa TaxID=597456 RepID=A0A0L7R4H3_9HYME|nr:hypothetical protein WH47_00680 [Habropoda laboriosa]
MPNGLGVERSEDRCYRRISGDKEEGDLWSVLDRAVLFNRPARRARRRPSMPAGRAEGKIVSRAKGKIVSRAKGKIVSRAESKIVGIVAGRTEGNVAGRAEGKVAGRAEGKVAGRTEGKVVGRIERKIVGRVEGKIEKGKSFIPKSKSLKGISTSNKTGNCVYARKQDPQKLSVTREPTPTTKKPARNLKDKHPRKRTYANSMVQHEER